MASIDEITKAYGAGLDTDSTCGSRTWATLFSFEQLIFDIERRKK